MDVNGTELLDEGDDAEYYSNGAGSKIDVGVNATDVADPPLSVELSGVGTMWGTIYGSTMDNPNYEEAYIDKTEEP